MSTKIIFGGIVIIGIVVAISLGFNTPDTEKMKTESSATTESTANIVVETVTPVANPSEGAEQAEMEKAPEGTLSVGTYEAYSEDKLARAETGDVVLFFHAPWCPGCRGLDAAILKEATQIPAGLSILKVDYDTATDMRKKYGVTTQHTLVQVDAGGNLIKKWSGSSSLTSLVGNIE